MPSSGEPERSRVFVPFSYKGARYRISGEAAPAARLSVKRLWVILETYIAEHPEFKTSFSPLPAELHAPEIVLRMCAAAYKTGVGPMAAVAGAIAQMAAECAISRGVEEAIVENGGDIFIVSPGDVVVGLFAWDNSFGDRLALSIPATRLPLAVCSSSGVMGHSTSLGKCDLATVFSKDAALADAVATLAGNLVSAEKDIEPAIERIMGIEGVCGVIIVKNQKLGLAGEVPDIISAPGARSGTPGPALL